MSAVVQSQRFKVNVYINKLLYSIDTNQSFHVHTIVYLAYYIYLLCWDDISLYINEGFKRKTYIAAFSLARVTAVSGKLSCRKSLRMNLEFVKSNRGRDMLMVDAVHSDLRKQ